MNRESILNDIEVVFRPGRKPINNILKMITTGTDNDIIDYLNNATKYNINVLGTFKSVEDLDFINPLYHKFIYKCLKENKTQIIAALLNNGYNAFAHPTVIDTNNYYKSSTYQFIHYFKQFKNTLSSFKEKEKYISFFAHGLNKINSEHIKEYENVLSGSSAMKNSIYLLAEPDILNLPVFQKNALRFYQIMKNMNEKEIGERLKAFRADPENEKYLSEVYSNIFVYRKKSNIKQIISYIFEDVEDFNENFLNLYLYSINGLYDDIGHELLLLKKSGYDFKVTNFNEKTYLSLVYKIVRTENYEESLSLLKDMGVRIGQEDVLMNLFSRSMYDPKNIKPVDVSRIFYRDDPFTQSFLKKEAFIKVLTSNNNEVEKIQNGLDVIDIKTMESEHLKEMLGVVADTLREKRKSNIVYTSTTFEKDKIIAMSTALLEQIQDRSDFIELLTENKESQHILYGLTSYYVFPQAIVQKLKDESVEFFQHYMNAMFNQQSEINIRQILMMNIKNIFDWNIYPYCFEKKETQYPDVTNRNCLYLFVKLLHYKINDNIPDPISGLQKKGNFFSQLSDEKEKEFFDYIMNEKPEEVDNLIRIARGNETTDPKYEAYCQKQLLKVEKKLIDSFEVKKKNRL